LIFGELAFGLLKLNLEWTRIDVYKVLALPDHLAFLEVDFRDLAVHTGADGNRVERGYGPESIEVHGKIAALRASYNNGYDEPSCSPCLAALAFAAARSVGSLRFNTRVRSAEIPNSYPD
jgi:hypothetical protein